MAQYMTMYGGQRGGGCRVNPETNRCKSFPDQDSDGKCTLGSSGKCLKVKSASKAQSPKGDPAKADQLLAFNNFKKNYMKQHGYLSNEQRKAQGKDPNPIGAYIALVRQAGAEYREATRTAASASKGKQYGKRSGSACIGMMQKDCTKHPRCNWVKEYTTNGKTIAEHCTRSTADVMKPDQMRSVGKYNKSDSERWELQRGGKPYQAITVGWPMNT